MGELVKLSYRPDLSSRAVVRQRRSPQRLTQPDRLPAIPLAHRFARLDQLTIHEPRPQAARRREFIGAGFEVTRVDKGLNQVKRCRGRRSFDGNLSHADILAHQQNGLTGYVNQRKLYVGYWAYSIFREVAEDEHWRSAGGLVEMVRNSAAQRCEGHAAESVASQL